MSFDRLYDALRSWAESRDVRVGERRLGPETPAEFDGVSVTMNPDFGPEERCFYLAHALGSIVIWSVDHAGSRAVYDELRAAKRGGEPGRLEAAVAGFAAFEERASRYAVQILHDLGRPEVIPAYTNFARADLAMMERFHRDGTAPVWREFFAEWNREVAAGRRQVRPYTPEAVPPFQPTPFRTQEVVQETDGER